jgi:alkylation response protein AidB-like acyl-CoA dehydrogenase
VTAVVDASEGAWSDFLDSELRADIRSAIEGVTKRVSRAYYLAAARNREEPTELYSAMAEQGLFALGVPEEMGGEGGGLCATATVMEGLSQAGLPPMHFSLTAFSRNAVIHHGTPEQIERYVVPTLDASVLFAFALTEPDAGTNSFAMSTTAKRQPNGTYLLNGSKVFISGAASADYLMVVARTAQPEPGEPKSRGISVFVVPRGAAGITLQEMDIEWHAPERQFAVSFDDVVLESSTLIGEEGGGSEVLFDSLNSERVVIAAWTIGLGDYALEKAVAYARERAPWGEPIGRYQGVAHPLAHAKAQLEAARVMTFRAAQAYDRGEPAAALANMAKLIASEAAEAAVDAAIQTFGGSAFDKQSDIVTLWPMIRILRIAPINNEMVLNYIAERVLGLPRSY